MEDFEKIVNPGAQDVGRATLAPVFCRIRYKAGKLSITGAIGPMRNGDCRGSCGQIVGAEINEYADGWTPALVSEFYAVWNAWHLNNMRAGCEHQRAEKWEDVRINPKELPDSHANRDERGIMAMRIRPEEHPAGLLCKPCAVCGYKYGSAWLSEDVPADVLEFLRALPGSKLVPAWC